MNEENLIEKIKQLSKKYSSTGQDLSSYLDGLLYADYVGYWNYIHLETLLSLQTPKTDFPDEQIFIIYHQITELYFKLCLLEIEDINKNGRHIIDTGEDLGWNKTLTIDLFIQKMERINRYLNTLIDSFTIMTKGMEKKQFLKFRMALLPSSGFQSVQYRMIELRSTNLAQLHPKELQVSSKSLKTMYNSLYWKHGAIDLKTQKKTYTLKQFERKYDERLMKLANKMKNKNIWTKYNALNPKDRKNKTLIKLLKEYDVNINVNWKLAHYKSAVKYLKTKNNSAAATGGTNWESFLPPKFQKIIFFPDLWTKKEQENWGKNWVKSMLK